MCLWEQKWVCKEQGDVGDVRRCADTGQGSRGRSYAEYMVRCGVGRVIVMCAMCK